MKCNVYFIIDSEDSTSLTDILSEYYDLNQEELPCPEEKDLLFDSNFESGNLFAAFKVSNKL